MAPRQFVIPEWAFFVAACIRRSLGLTGDTVEGGAGIGGIAWQDLAAITASQRLESMLYAGLDDRPELVHLRNALRPSAAASMIRAQNWLEPTLQTSLHSLRSRGIEAIVLKGAALAYTVYPRPDLRSLADVDLLIASEDQERALECLIANGFNSVRSIQKPDHHSEPCFLAGVDLGLELHTDLLPRPHPYALDPRQIRRRAVGAKVAGMETLTLSPVDSLHLACVHLSFSHRYRWSPLRSLVDILAVVSETREEFDWDRFVSIVEASHTAGAVYWPLRYSREWLGTPVPSPVLGRLAPPNPALARAGRGIAGLCFGSGDRQNGHGNPVFTNLMLTWSLFGGCSTRQQACAIKDTLFPSPSSLGHLPGEVATSRLRYAAYLLRPSRIARGLGSLVRLMTE